MSEIAVNPKKSVPGLQDVSFSMSGVAGCQERTITEIADEVRNFASKSDEAAKSTSGLIRMSIQSAESGSRIAQTVAEKMRDAIEFSGQ